MKVNIVDRSLSDFFHSEFKEYSLYTIHHRAIPSLLDGFKPIQRKIMWTSSHRAKRMVKVVALAGYVIAESNYHHGDKSVNDAIVKMAATWSNNVPLLKSDDGNFGWRLIRGAASPRYIMVKMSDLFNKWFTDFNVLQYKQQDDGNIYEPTTYYSKVPWSLINGCVGVATGYSVNIHPRNPKKVAKVISGLLDGETPNISDLDPYFPEYTGKTDGYKVSGEVRHVSRNVWDILSLPATYTLDMYTKKLDTLVESGDLRKYDQSVSRKSAPFRVWISHKIKNPAEVIKLLKLEVNLGGETFVALHGSKLLVFETIWDYIGKFMEERTKVAELSIANNVDIRKDMSLRLKIKKHFIQHMIKDGLNGLTRDLLEHRALSSVEALMGSSRPDMVGGLTKMSVTNFTEDEIHSLDEKVSKLKEEIDSLGGVTPEAWMKEGLLTL